MIIVLYRVCIVDCEKESLDEHVKKIKPITMFIFSSSLRH